MFRFLALAFLLSCDDTADIRIDDTGAVVDTDDTDPGELEHEGDAAGECADGADNDRDGDFDCADSDCAGAPDCAADTDTADTDTGDTDTGDTDTGDTDTDTDTGDTDTADTDTADTDDTDTGADTADTDTGDTADTDTGAAPNVRASHTDVYVHEHGMGSADVYISGTADPLEVECPSWISVSGAPATLSKGDGWVQLTLSSSASDDAPLEDDCTFGNATVTVHLLEEGEPAPE